MKNILIILFISTTIIQASLIKPFKVPSPIPYVNINNFSGLWYETARTYNSFEENCVAASIEYKLSDENTLEVKNRCFEYEIGGKLIEYTGKAQALNGDNFATLEKTYFWIFTQEYLILYLEDDYSTAIMADNEMKNMWIMNRTAFMEQEKLDKILVFLKDYMDTSRLIFTPQDKEGRYK